MRRRLIALVLAAAVALPQGCAQAPVRPAEPELWETPAAEPAPPGPRPKWVQQDDWLDDYPVFKGMAFTGFLAGLGLGCLAVGAGYCGYLLAASGSNHGKLF
jgi:hypothetical protein